MSFSLGELAASLDAAVQDDVGLIIEPIAPLDQAGADQLAFLSNPLYLNQAVNSGAGAIIMSLHDLEALENQGHATGRNWLIAANPYAAFTHVAQRFVTLAARPVIPGTRPSASVEESTKVSASCSISPNVTIETGTVFGERMRIAGNNSADADARIGDGMLLHANASVYRGCEVGARCILHSGVMIGADGFGLAPDFGPQGGEWVKIPQVGRAVIGDDVEIGANTAIDRGAMADTVVEQGCKIDDQVQIAHNVHVGTYTVIADCTTISSSTRVGRYYIIGGAASLAGHLTIADRVTVSGGVSITKSITKPGGHFTNVFPFMPRGGWEHNAAIVRGLTHIRERLQQLEQRVRDLQ